METLLATYIIASAAILTYVLRLVVANTRLGRRLKRVETLMSEPRSGDAPRAKAA